MSTRNSGQIASAKSSTSLVTSNLAALADPPTPLVDGAMLDYFVIEAVNTLRESSRVATARAKEVEKEMIEAGLIPAPPLQPPSLPLKKENPRDSVASLHSRTSSPANKPTIDEEEEAVRLRLENIGMHVGANFAERLCRDKPLFGETLEVIKFICKDVWYALWEKQVDNLRTNHRGVYVLQDNSFRPISRLSSWQGRSDGVKRAKLYVALPAGVIKGALSRLGYQATVTAEINSLPQCTFQVKLPKGA